MKRLVSFLVMLMFVLTSCGRSSGDWSVKDKLNQIEKGWTEEQVCDLLGQPDRHGETSSVIDVYYRVDSTTEAAVYYWIEQAQQTVLRVILIDNDTGETTVITE